jgi:hypothetical protein
MANGHEGDVSSVAIDAADIKAWESSLWFLRKVPWVLLMLMLGLVLSTMFWRDQHWLDAVRSAFLTLICASAAVWFVICFTAPSGADYLRQVFIFAYAFTFGSFALLITPFLAQPDSFSTERSDPTVGVLQLVRGCVHGDRQEAGSSVSPVGLCPPQGWLGEAKAGQTEKSGTTEPKNETDKPDVVERVEIGREFSWLVSIGGATVRRFLPLMPGVAPEQCKGFPRAADSSSKGQPSRNCTAYEEVHGGLAVPLFVIVLAFVGGAVSLSRRIPEYQRRSHPAYESTEREVKMQDFQAREAVVFQIMQLVSAPFLAMATWYIFAPATMGAASLLAFGTGFASEPLLLMVRGMIEGIRPEGTRFSQAKEHGSVAGTVRNESGPVPDVAAAQPKPEGLAIEVRVAIQDWKTLDQSSLLLTLDDKPLEAPDDGTLELRLPPGSSQMLRAQGLRNGTTVAGEVTLAPGLDDDQQVVYLTLA